MIAAAKLAVSHHVARSVNRDVMGAGMPAASAPFRPRHDTGIARLQSGWLAIGFRGCVGFHYFYSAASAPLFACLKKDWRRVKTHMI
jgi:hypothetical protein